MKLASLVRFHEDECSKHEICGTQLHTGNYRADPLLKNAPAMPINIRATQRYGARDTKVESLFSKLHGDK
jgi:hypothetical protein